LGWLRELKQAGVKRIRQVQSFSASGSGQLESLTYTLADGSTTTVPANVLLAHEGVVPSIHMTQALGCAHRWDEPQQCLVPELDQWGTTSLAGIAVAGDGAGIAGADAACVRGELAAIGLLMQAGKLSDQQAIESAAPLRK